MLEDHLIVDVAADIIHNLEEMYAIYDFGELCTLYVENHFKLLEYLFGVINEDKLVAVAFKYLENHSEILKNEVYERYDILNKNKLLFDTIITNIEELYFYKMSYTGLKKHVTETFDYVKFGKYRHFIGYIFKYIANNTELLETDKVQGFLSRCQKVINTDGSDEQLESYKYIKTTINELNSEFKLF